MFDIMYARYILTIAALIVIILMDVLYFTKPKANKKDCPVVRPDIFNIKGNKMDMESLMAQASELQSKKPGDLMGLFGPFSQNFGAIRIVYAE